MKFIGPTHNGVDWNSSNLIEITFESLDELSKNNDKYLKAKRAIVRTSSEAKSGDKKELTFILPDKNSFTLQASIEKVKAQADQPYSIALFKFDELKKEYIEKINKALIPPSSNDLDFDDDLDLDIDILATTENEPVKTESPKQTPTKPEKHQEKVKRSKADEARVQAYLSDYAPDDDFADQAELPEELKGVSGDLIMPKRDDEVEDLFLEHKKFIVAFILMFTKSVQRSSYYGDKNHPEAIKSKKGLYALFRRIIGKNREVSFIKKAVGKERDILIDGVLDEMLTLRDIMPQGMSNLYIPKFMEYLERRCLISFSIKRIISQEKFDTFIDLLSQYSPEFKDDSKKEGERFTRTLIENGVVEVSAIFDEDIIASGRKLPWQAELTLSRLKKDLKTVPLLKNATEDELRKIKISIFRDTIKPLRVPGFMIAVLLNSDLIMEGMEDSPVLMGINVEEFMINGAEINFLAETSLELVKEIVGVRELQIKAPLEAQRTVAAKQEKVLMRIFKHITSRFNNEKSKESENAFEEFFKNKLIPFKDLPISVQERISNKKLMKAFLTNADEIMERFNSPLSSKEFSDFISRFQRVIPLLSEKKEYLLVGRIIDSSRKHLDDRDVRRKSLTKRLFDYVGSTNILKELKEAFESDDKELRDLALTVFTAFGKQAAPMLLDILKSHDDKWVRKQIIRSLTDIGPGAVQPMINELYKEDNPWYFLRNLIAILGELGDRKIVGKLNLLLYHENASVREETINTLYKISGENVESHLIKALSDDDSKVRGRAISCLGSMESQNDKVLNFYIEVLEGRNELENEGLQIQVYNAVSKLTNLDNNRKQNIENILIKNLEAAYGGGLFSFLKKQNSSTVSDSIKLAICSALGSIANSKKAKSILNKVAKEKDTVLVQRAEQALKSIAKRSI